MPTSDNGKLVEPKSYLNMVAKYLRSIADLWLTVDQVSSSGARSAIGAAMEIEDLALNELPNGVTYIPSLRTFFDQPEEKDKRYALTQSAGTGDNEPKQTVFDVDEWLDHSAYEVAKSQELAYVHFMLTHFRKPGWEKAAHNRFMQCFRLFVDYEEQTWRVTGASRLGDIWLTANLTDAEPQPYYDRRVTLDFSKLSNWRGMPSDVLEPDEPWRPVVFNPNRPKKSLSSTLRKGPGRHYKHVANMGTLRVGETAITGVELLEEQYRTDFPPGTKLYVRTK